MLIPHGQIDKCVPDFLFTQHILQFEPEQTYIFGFSLPYFVISINPGHFRKTKQKDRQ